MEENVTQLQDSALNPPRQGSQAIRPATYAAAVAGGVLAAVAGGVIWGLLVIFTGYEIGYVAWGLGLVAGFAVALFARGEKGVPLQVIAVLAGLLGIVIGKYFTFFHFLKQAVASESGAEAASNITVFSMGVVQMFFKNISVMVSGYDLLWVLLAVATAWSIPKGDIAFKWPAGK